MTEKDKCQQKNMIEPKLVPPLDIVLEAIGLAVDIVDVN